MGAAEGFIAVAVAVLFFGSNFIPVKKYKTGDGIFFQWVMSSAIWTVGLIVHLSLGSPKFEPLAMLGGALWAIGNVLCVPVIHFIGMGLGLLIWGSVNLVFGWSSGKFGLFGLKKDTGVNIPWLNVLGAVTCLLSLVTFFFVRPTAPGTKPRSQSIGNIAYKTMNNEVSEVAITEDDDDDMLPEPSISRNYSTYGRAAEASSKAQGADHAEENDDFAAFRNLTPFQSKILGFGMAIVAGVFFGVNFDPPQYLMDHPGHPRVHSSHALHYAFSHFSGAFLTSTGIFLIYAAVKRNRPSVYPEVILPGFVSGIMWGIAQCAWFIANQELSFVVSFPIISTGPGIVASMWGIFLFHEIRGRRNFIFFGISVSIILAGVSMIAVSKVA